MKLALTRLCLLSTAVLISILMQYRASEVPHVTRKTYLPTYTSTPHLDKITMSGYTQVVFSLQSSSKLFYHNSLGG